MINQNADPSARTKVLGRDDKGEGSSGRGAEAPLYPRGRPVRIGVLRLRRLEPPPLRMTAIRRELRELRALRVLCDERYVLLIMTVHYDGSFVLSGTGGTRER